MSAKFVPLVVLVGCAGPAVVPPEGIKLSASGDHRTNGEVVLSVEPQHAYELLRDFTNWPTIFPDVLRVSITSQQGDEALVTMIGPNDHHDNLHFHNRPEANTIWFEDTGGVAEVQLEIALVPGPTPGTTLARGTIYANVNGIASLVVTDAKIRNMSQQKLVTDLAALRSYFAKTNNVSRR
jgi:carbon monoxide dehydrogenase subunit G